ncbi:hypothetical protein SAMN05421813_103159 [Daejeonella rubra]|uniref:Lysylphosphatidylglycerol synthase TM region n=1 Tax=Daejeonella rubra TaxID=990371 RepID=A0A1G9NRJ2_9SPHI|nr:lysylphosphatidylglycerol synthase domain-containing protein [Daejeonella rubra]SDL89226.1 hypothetical protein SAMN05421813_103159 [Daejeonella rubra]
MNSQTKKILSIGIKIAVVGLAFWFIFQKISNNQNIDNFKSLLSTLSISSVLMIMTSVFLLMFLNWFIEALKWKYLVSGIEKISTWKAVESVFCGLTWAVFTPNRIGEYGGRVFFLSPRKRIMGVIAMSVGAIGKMVITNVLGSLALLWFVIRFTGLNSFIDFGLGFLVLVFCSLFLLFYFNIKWVYGLLIKINFLKRFKHFFIILSRYKHSDILRILIYSLSRYLIFTTQYFLIIHFLVPDIQVFDMVMILFVFYFIQSALPSLDLLDIGVRASVATYFFAFVTNQEIAIMAAIASIWLINLIIPAILGSVFVLKLNFFGSSNN